MKNIPIKTLRAALRAKYGARKYKIIGTACCEQVHIYGLMPNSQTVGWWLMGDILTAQLWLGLYDDEPGICPACSGSGEGQHEGTRCYQCKGAGEC